MASVMTVFDFDIQATLCHVFTSRHTILLDNRLCPGTGQEAPLIALTSVLSLLLRPILPPEGL